MERGERIEMNPELGRIYDNIEKVKKQDTKNQKIDIDSPVKVGKDINAKNPEVKETQKKNEINGINRMDSPVESSRRELTEEAKTDLRDCGFSDKFLEKCTIDSDGKLYYKTERSDLDGKTYENGVPYRNKTLEINGRKVEGVFPEFNSLFDTHLNKENYTKKTYAKECNARLKEAVANDPKIRNKFTKEQLKDIEEGRTPRGYVWHHNEEPGKMQLVKREDHDRTVGGAPHTGGSVLWGPDSVDRGKKGESF